MNTAHTRKWRQSHTTLLTILIILVAGIVPARAQFTQGGISGRVLDPSGKPIVGAKISLEDTDSHATQTATTDGSGEYTFAALQPHPYQLSASASGFSQTDVSVTLGISQQLVEDLQLKVGQANQQITVQASGAAVALQEESHTVSQLVTQTEINSLPVSGRSFLGLASLGAGAQPGGDLINYSNNGGSAQYFQTTGQQFIPAGQSVGHTSFLQDGVSNVQLFTQAANILPDMDAIQEFSVSTTGMSAQYSQPGVINVITKSGTNRFHGTAYDFLRNGDMNANNWFNNLAGVPVPKDNFNQYGGTIGGPIIKDKVFFFFDYEGQRETLGAATALLVPTAAEKGGDFSDWLNGVSCGTGCTKQITLYDPSTYNQSTGAISAFPQNKIPTISPFAQKFFSFLPSPTSGILSDGDNYHATLPETNTLNQYLGRIDYDISQRDRIFGTYEYYNQPTIQTSFVPNLYGNTFQRQGTNAVLEETHSFNAPIINIARVGYNRSIFFNSQLGVGSRDWVSYFGLLGLDPPLSQNSPPYLGFTTYMGGGLGNPYAPQGAKQNLFQYADEVDIVKSKHTIRIGFEWNRIQVDGNWTLYNSGVLTFNGQYTSNHSTDPADYTQGLDLADLELGYPNSATGGVGSTIAAFRENDISTYFNDNYKITPKLNLTLGLRYQFSSPPKDKYGRAATYDLATASSVPGPWNSNYLNFAPRVGFAYSLDNKSVLRGGYGIYYTSTPYNVLQFMMANPPNYLTQTINYTIPDPVNIATIFPAFTPGSTVFSPYIVSKHNPTSYLQQWNLDYQRSLNNTMLFDIGYVGNVGRHLSIRLNPNQASPEDPSNPTPIQSRRPYPAIGDVLAQYDIGTSSYNALQASLRKSFSRDLSFQASYTWSKSMDLLSTDGGDVINGLDPGRNYGPSDFNRGQLFVFSYTYELPFGPNKRFLNTNNIATRYVVGGWQVNGITSYGSGLPFSVITSQDLSNTGSDHMLIASQTCNGKLTNPTRTEWFNTSCFVQPGAGLLGNAGRNILPQGMEKDWDFSLFKNVPLTRGILFQLRGEFFDVLNQHSFVNPDATVGDPKFGSMLNATGPRTVQVAMKLLF